MSNVFGLGICIFIIPLLATAELLLCCAGAIEELEENGRLPLNSPSCLPKKLGVEVDIKEAEEVQSIVAVIVLAADDEDVEEEGGGGNGDDGSAGQEEYIAGLFDKDADIDITGEETRELNN